MYDNELTLLRADIHDAHAREVASLRQSLALSDQRVAQLEMKLERLETAKDEAVSNIRSREAQLVEENATLRSNVRILENERDRSENLVSALRLEARQSKAECNALREKIDIIKIEYYNLQRRASEQKGNDNVMMAHLRTRSEMVLEAQEELDMLLTHLSSDSLDILKTVLHTKQQAAGYGAENGKRRNTRDRLLDRVSLAKQVQGLRTETMELTAQLKAEKKARQNFEAQVRTLENLCEKLKFPDRFYRNNDDTVNVVLMNHAKNIELELHECKRLLEEQTNRYNTLNEAFTMTSDAKKEIERHLENIIEILNALHNGKPLTLLPPLLAIPTKYSL